ncbi:MAG: hypothetical protein IT559_06830 [Alphaproteobacteria bacterium]|nr:hypothetical protein [Alphaproteobacteria bacterium]
MKNISPLTLCLCLLMLSSCRTVGAMLDDLDSMSVPTISINREPRIEDLAESHSCPEVRVIEELGTYNEFSDPGRTRANELVSRVTISGTRVSCQMDAQTAIVDLNVTFQGALGPDARRSNAEKPSFTYPFFVAIASPQGKIMAKEVFAASMSYGAGENQHTYRENIRQIIPIEKNEKSGHFKILLGFQLADEQLSYNRAVIKAEKKKAQQQKAASAPKPKAVSGPNPAQSSIERESLKAQPTNLTGGHWGR